MYTLSFEASAGEKVPDILRSLGTVVSVGPLDLLQYIWTSHNMCHPVVNPSQFSKYLLYIDHRHK